MEVADYSRPGRLAVYPYAGMRDVPWSWDGREIPDPLPNTPKPVGPPISVLRGFGRSLSVSGATLSGPAGPVAATPVSDSTWGAASLIPLQPLGQATTYEAHFTGSAEGTPFDVRWSFTTATMAARPSLDALSLSSGTYLGWSPGAGSAPTSYLLKCSGCPAAIERRIFAPSITSAFDPIPSGTHVLYFLTPYVHDVPGQTAYVSLNGGGTEPAYHARWYSQSAYPENLRPGEIASVWISFMNTGTAPWVRGVWGQQANLGLNLDDTQPYQLHMDVNWLWNNRIAATDAAVVAPGEVGEFRFQVRAPMQPGVYSLHARPVVDGQVWMEDDGVFLNFTVR